MLDDGVGIALDGCVWVTNPLDDGVGIALDGSQGKLTQGKRRRGNRRRGNDTGETTQGQVHFARQIGQFRTRAVLGIGDFLAAGVREVGRRRQGPVTTARPTRRLTAYLL